MLLTHLASRTTLASRATARRLYTTTPTAVSVTYRDALNPAIDEEFERDNHVFVVGEQVEKYECAYKVTKGLHNKRGNRRVVERPITEADFKELGTGAVFASMDRSASS